MRFSDKDPRDRRDRLELDLTKIDRKRIKNVILEMSLDEFELVLAAWSNMSMDCAAGPEALEKHPMGMMKGINILRVLADAERADLFSQKLKKMSDNLVNTDNI